MPSKIKSLVVLSARERTQSRGDCVIASRLNTAIVRRVSVDQLDPGSVEQTIEVSGLAAITTEQTMRAEDPKVARLCE